MNGKNELIVIVLGINVEFIKGDDFDELDRKMSNR